MYLREKLLFTFICKYLHIPSCCWNCIAVCVSASEAPAIKRKQFKEFLVHTCIGIISLTDENDVMSDVTINFSQSIQILFHNIQYMKINTKKIEILPGDCNEISNYYYIEFYSIIQWKQFYIKFFQNLPLLARFI